MLSFYRTALKRDFHSIPTVIALALLALAQGVLIAFFNLSGASSVLTSTLYYLAYPTVLLLPLPALLRASREHATANEAYLLSLPITPLGIVTARYLASLTVYLTASLPMLLFPLAASLLGEINLATSYTAMLGLLLLGAATLALTLAICTSIRRTLARVLVTYGIILSAILLHLLPTYLPISYTAAAVISGISPFSAAEAFLYGYLFLPGLIGLVLLTLALLAAAALSLGRRHGARLSRWLAEAITAFLLLLALLPAPLAPFLPHRAAYLNVTRSEVTQISGLTQDYLKTVNQPVTIYYLCAGGERESYLDMKLFLESYTTVQPLIRVKYVDTEKDSAFSMRYTSDTLNNHSMIVESRARHYVIDSASLYHYENTKLGQKFSAPYYAYCLAAADYYATNGSIGSYDEVSVEYGSGLYLYADQTTAYFDGDALLTNAILYVTSPAVPTVSILCGKGAGLESNLRASLVANGLFLQEISEIKSLADTDLLLIYAPARDLNEQETALLAAYMESGGRLFLATTCAYTDYPNLLSVTEKFGLGLAQNKNMLWQKSASGSYNNVFFANVDLSADASDGFSGYVYMPVPHLIRISPIDGVSHTEWITTSASGSYLNASESGDEPLTPEQIEILDSRLDTYVCGAIAEKGDAGILWISSSLMMGLTGYAASNGGNYALIRSAINWATDNPLELMTIDPAPIRSQTLSLSSGALAFCSILYLLILPAALALPCAIRIYLRKKR